MVFPKIGISRFFGTSRKNWDFRQNIWISGARGALKSLKMCEIPIFYQIPIFGKLHGKGPGLQFGSGLIFGSGNVVSTVHLHIVIVR